MEHKLKKNLRKAAQEIIFAVGEGKISGDIPLVKVAAIVMKSIDETLPADSINYNKHRGDRTSMLEHALKVVEKINMGLTFNKACKTIAEKEDITIGSVQQACCRSLKLNANVWNSFATKNIDSKKLILDRLMSKYPEKKDMIIKTFEI